jgi:hypothetical protein
MKKKRTIPWAPGLLLLAALATLSLTAGSLAQSQPQAGLMGKPWLARLTKAQKRERDQLVYTGYPSDREIPELLAERQEDNMVKAPMTETFGITPADFDLNAVLTAGRCVSDAIVRGTVRAQHQRLTDRRNSMLTVNELQVLSVFMDDTENPLHPGQTIHVARPGGRYTLAGTRYSIRVVEPAHQPLEVGQEYVLFLTYHKDRPGESYVARTIAFGVEDGKIVSLTDFPQPEKLRDGKDAAPVIEAVRAAAAATCGGAQ